MFTTALCEAAKETFLSPTEAIILSLIGIAIVFAVLIVLWVIITLTGKIIEKSPAMSKKMSKIFKKKSKEEEPAVEAPKANGTCGELVLINTDERDAAMIMAIVADTTGVPLNELRFKSIKRIDE